MTPADVKLIIEALNGIWTYTGWCLAMLVWIAIK